MKILVLLLALLTVSECEKNVTGQTGQNITLPCKYDRKTNGPTEVCWGRGLLPDSKCSNQLLATDGHKVIKESRASSRYQLQGRLDEGNVSLTIMNVTEEDTGLYGCRVEISGWFNDEKHHVHLTVNRAPRLISTPSSGTTSSSSDIHQTTAATPTSVPCPADNNRTASALEDSDKGVTLVVLASVVFMLLVLVTAGVLIIMDRRLKKQKVPSLPPQMKRPTQVEENIYHIDAKDDGVYETCPSTGIWGAFSSSMSKPTVHGVA